MADQFTVNGADYTSAADALAAAVPDANGNISITAINGDLTLDKSVAATGIITLRVGPASVKTDLIAGEKLTSTVTINSDFTGTLNMQASADELKATDGTLQGTDAATAPFRIIIDGAQITGSGGFYSWQLGYVEVKNGAQATGFSDSHIRGDVLVTGEGTLLSGTFVSTYAGDFSSNYPDEATLTISDGATFSAQVSKSAVNVFNLGHTSKAYRSGNLIIKGGIFTTTTDLVVNSSGTINLSNSSANGKTYYGQIIFANKDAATLVTTNAATDAVTISLNSADYSSSTENYKIIDVQDASAALDLSKVSITVDGQAFTLGRQIGTSGKYLTVVDNDLIVTSPPITVTKANGEVVGKYLTFSEAVTSLPEAGCTITFSDNAAETTTKPVIVVMNDVTLSGKAVISKLGRLIIGAKSGEFGNTGAGKAVNVTLAEGADITLSYSGSDADIQGRHNSVDASSTLTITNARLTGPGQVRFSGLISVSGSGKKDASGNQIYGFATTDANGDTVYVENFLLPSTETGTLEIQPRYAAQGDYAMKLTNGAWAQANKITIGDDRAGILGVQDSKLVCNTSVIFAGQDGNLIEISGDSLVSLNYVGYTDNKGQTLCTKTGSMSIDGVQADVSVTQFSEKFTGLTVTASSLQLDAVLPGNSKTLFEVTGTGTAIPTLTLKVDGTELTAGTDGTYQTADGYYTFSWVAAGDDGIANDLIVTSKAPPISVTTSNASIGKYETLEAAISAINGDSGTGPYNIRITEDITETTQAYLQKDAVLSGAATINNLNLWLGNSDKTKVANLTIAEGSDFDVKSDYLFNGRYLSDNSAASTLTVDNARISFSTEVSMNGPIKIVGNGTGTADSTGNIYGFSKAGKYVENFSSQKLTVLDLANANQGVGLQLTNYAWVKAGYTTEGQLKLKNDKATAVSIDNSRLDVLGAVSYEADGGAITISGDSVFTATWLGYNANGSSISKTGTFSVTGMDSEISVGQISSAVTAINFTLTEAEVTAGLVNIGDSYTLFELTDAAAAFDANTAISVMIDGASYKLNDRITINDSIFEVALGGTDDNDLMLELLAKKPDLSACDVYVGNLTGKDGVAVHDTANKLTVFESDGTMSEGAVWGLGDWDMLDVADVNGDGVDDILISYQHDNGVTGVGALINQQDGSYGMVHQDIRGWSNDLWEYLCSADVNGDGTEDILTIETDSIAAGRDKNVNAWIMDSTGQYSEDMRICGKNTDWEIEGFGDVTGDGKADGILRFKKLVAFWEHDGKNDSVLKEVGQMSTSWKVIGSDDFTGDGLADILFGNSSAQYKLWTDIDEKSYTEINLGTMKNSSLELAGIGDFNGDGKADILWQAADGGLHWGEAQAGKLNNLTTIA